MAEADYWQVQKEYRNQLRGAAAVAAEAVRISLQSSFTVDPLAAYIWRAASDEEIATEIRVGPFDQYAQEFLNAESELYRQDPELVFLFPKPARADLAADLVRSLRAPVEALLSRSGARLVVSNFIVPARPFLLHGDAEAQQVAEGNRLLGELISGFGRVSPLDLDTLAAHYGKERVADWKLHYLGNIDLGPGFQERVAAKCMTFIRLTRRPARKCLVLDLDNTLWGGVVGEEGPGGIALAPHGPGSEYVVFQEAIRRLTERGVILAVNSRNNPEDAMEVFDNHPHMALRREHFAAMRINWQDKAANLREIAAEINLGTESLVFLDDSPTERGWVRSQMPEVLVPELPADPAFYAPFLEGLDVFEVLDLTEEDRKRSEMYARQVARRRLEASSASLDDYIKSLGIALRVAPLDPETLPRACQMIMKTNQFNLTTRRHPEGRMRAFMDDADCEVYTLRASDVYGDSGVTGLAILSYREGACVIDTFLLSCRVLGRKIEETFLHALAEAAGKRAGRLIGEYIPTKKNGQTEDFYPRNGFRPAPREGEIRRFELDFAAGSVRPCELHELTLEGFEP